VFTIENIFNSDSDNETDDFDVCEEKKIELSVGKWVLVKYDNKKFPGEIVKVMGEECEVTVMHASGKFWKWPQKEDKIFYDQKNIVKMLRPPEVAGSRGQFVFEDL